MRLIAIDPGESTGYATGRVEEGKLYIMSHGDEPWVPFCYRLNRTQGGENPFDVVIYETWNLRKPKELYGSDMPSSQCIGQIKAAVNWNPEHRAKLIKSAPAHKPIADSYMLRLGLHLPASDVEHNRDAIRHLVHYSVLQLEVREAVYDI